MKWTVWTTSQKLWSEVLSSHTALVATLTQYRWQHNVALHNMHATETMYVELKSSAVVASSFPILAWKAMSFIVENIDDVNVIGAVAWMDCRVFLSM